MSVEHRLAFVAASAVLPAIPGPTVLLVISQALGHGRQAATATTASMSGPGALLAASATPFTDQRRRVADPVEIRDHGI